MLFNQLEFLILVATVFGLLFLVRANGPRKLVLLAASLYFYAYWDWRFLGLLAFGTVIDYYVALAMEATDDARRRKRLLLFSLVTNLGLLGFFKYFNFFIDSFQAAFGGLLGLNLQTLTWIILPVGISFYTFQTLSYTIDVYRRELPACRRFSDFALFVSFFPQLVAGPIVRAHDFLPQLSQDRPLSWRRAGEGFALFSFGLFKKVFIADRIAGYVDGVFASPDVYGGLTVWIAVLAYAVQIYCDFSGYSDMAIGTARALGYDFCVNFDHPYLSRSITEFWRRWHMSLSTWLRDYLYIPLGGNRRGPGRTYVNLMLTMLLGGLWHGAAWTFVVWGFIHGGVLALERLLKPTVGPMTARWPAAARALAGWAYTLLVVLVAWVFFRAPDFGTAAAVLRRMFVDFEGVLWVQPFTVFAVLLIAAIQALQLTPLAHLRQPRMLSVFTPTVVFLCWWLVLAFPATGFTPFIYFQF
jgi:alginate O-acetyltransferase complex protein AlgI